MKKLLRLPPVHAVTALLASLYIQFVRWGTRWRIEHHPQLAETVAQKQPYLMFFWHGWIAPSPVLGRFMHGMERWVITSRSRDGDFITLTMGRLGFPTVRGSARTDGDAIDKGGAAVFRQALRHIRKGAIVVVTPDGPRGPAQVMKPGAVALARHAQVPVYMFGLAVEPARRARSWDRQLLPLPFGRGHVTVDGPFMAPRDADENVIENLRGQWEAQLNATQARADALLAARR